MVAISTKKPKAKFLKTSGELSNSIRQMAATKPIEIPASCLAEGLFFSHTNPISMVNNGVSAFSIPVRLLLICVSARVNKKAGIKFPKTPITRTPKKYFLKSIFVYFK